MSLFSEHEIKRRISGLGEIVEKHNLSGAIIHHNADMFYFTGTIQDGYFIVASSGEVSFCLRRNYQRALQQTHLRPLVLISGMKDLKDITLSMISYGGNGKKRIGLALDVLPASTYLFMKDSLFPGWDLVDISLDIRMLRAVKSAEEVELMRGAAVVSHEVYQAVPDFLREGITEWDLCVNLEYVARKNGHLGFVRVRNPRLEMYFGHILSGAEAAASSYGDSPTGGLGISAGFAQGSTQRVIKKGDMVSIDTMLSHQGYLNDQTRNFALGSPSYNLLKAHELSLKIHDFFKKQALPGVVSGKIYEDIWRFVEITPFKEFFMGTEKDRVSFVGHGLGIEVDEFPFIAYKQKTVLEEGMVIAFEPKFIIPGEGISGVENTYLITSHGAEPLNISKEEIIIL